MRVIVLQSSSAPLSRMSLPEPVWHRSERRDPSPEPFRTTERGTDSLEVRCVLYHIVIFYKHASRLNSLQL